MKTMKLYGKYGDARGAAIMGTKLFVEVTDTMLDRVKARYELTINNKGRLSIKQVPKGGD